jgi:hypothetical protein
VLSSLLTYLLSGANWPHPPHCHHLRSAPTQILDGPCLRLFSPPSFVQQISLYMSRALLKIALDHSRSRLVPDAKVGGVTPPVGVVIESAAAALEGIRAPVPARRKQQCSPKKQRGPYQKKAPANQGWGQKVCEDTVRIAAYSESIHVPRRTPGTRSLAPAWRWGHVLPTARWSCRPGSGSRSQGTEFALRISRVGTRNTGNIAANLADVRTTWQVSFTTSPAEMLATDGLDILVSG